MKYYKALEDLQGDTFYIYKNELFTENEFSGIAEIILSEYDENYYLWDKDDIENTLNDIDSDLLESFEEVNISNQKTCMIDLDNRLYANGVRFEREDGMYHRFKYTEEMDKLLLSDVGGNPHTLEKAFKEKFDTEYISRQQLYSRRCYLLRKGKNEVNAI